MPNITTFIKGYSQSSLSLQELALNVKRKELNFGQLKKMSSLFEASFDVKEKARLISFAAARVLGNIQPYLITGSKEISAEQCKKIEHEIEMLKTVAGDSFLHAASILYKKNIIYTKLITLLHYRYNNQNKEQLELDAGAKQKFYKGLQDDFFQIAACCNAYRHLKVNDVVEGPVPDLFYRVDKIITNDKGLKVTVLVPSNTESFKKWDQLLPVASNPIYCCRGTVLENTNNLLDDLEKNIGYNSFAASKEEIESSLRSTTETYGAAIIVGHSLGGAVAQNILAENCHKKNGQSLLIHSLYLYNSPGVGNLIVNKYKENVQNIPIEDRAKRYRYQHSSDLIPKAGGLHLPSTERIILSNPKDSLREAHSLIRFVSSWGRKPKKLPRYLILYAKFIKWFIEVLRILFSPFAKQAVHYKSKTQQKIDEEANRVHELFKLAFDAARANASSPVL